MTVFLLQGRHARIRGLVLLAAALATTSPTPLTAADWPTYRHDNRRSGVTDERLKAESLARAWTYRSPQPPQQAWAGPAKWDAYAGLRPLRSMRNYDPVFHVIASGNSVYFGSSVDDSVHSIDAATGAERWRFTTDGPVRVAPTQVGEALYFGSDDGGVYAVRADDGSLIWKYAPKPDRQRILNNGRFISHWPVRTGVLVADGTAYFAASLLPWRETYLCAIDAQTGKPTGAGHYCRALGGSRTMEGPPLASATELIFPQGRVAPLLVRRADGTPVGSLEGGGGCFALLTEDAEILHGPGNKTGWITQSRAKTRAKVATFGGGNAMVVDGDTAVVLSDQQLTAVNRKSRQGLWKVACDCPLTIVKAGPHLFVGGVDQVAAFDVKTGRQVWRASVHGRAYGLAVANGGLLVTTDEGEIVCFRADRPATRPAPRQVAGDGNRSRHDLNRSASRPRVHLDAQTGRTSGVASTAPASAEEARDLVGHWRFDRAAVRGPGGRPPQGDLVAGGQVRDLADKDHFSEAMPFAVAPYLQFLRPDRAVVRWQTTVPSPSIVHVRLGNAQQRYEDGVPTTDHRVTVEVPKRNRVYQYQIEGIVDGRRCYSPEYECDTFFNYTLPSFAESEPGRSADRATRESPQEPTDRPVRHHPESLDRDVALADAARQILATTGLDRGICLVIGCGDGQLAWQLVQQSQLKVIGVDTDARAVAAARKRLSATGGYGNRVAIHHVESLADLPWQGQSANLVVAQRTMTEGKPVGDAAEIARLLRPDGGIAMIGQGAGWTPQLDRKTLAKWFNAASLQYVIAEDEKGLWARVVRGPQPGSGQWSHQYGRADNSAFGGESLGGARRAGQFSVQWIGRPGPRAQADRNGRKPAPLATAGRLFVQGLHRLIALDAHNGTILWSLEIPRLERFNLPRDSSNWCADEDHLFVAVDQDCWQIDAATGTVVRRQHVGSGPRKEWHYDWGYVARSGPLLIGTAVKRGAQYVNFWGKSSAGWYDAPSGVATFKVCSDSLFAVNVAAPSGHEPTSAQLPAWTYTRGVIVNSTITATPNRVFFVACRNPGVLQSNRRRIDTPQLADDRHLVALDSRTGKTLWERPITTPVGTSVCYMAHGGGKIVLVASGEKRYHVDAFDDRDGGQVWHDQFDWPNGKHDHGKAMSRPAIVLGQLYVRPHVIDLETGKRLSKSMPGGGCGTYAATTQAILFRSGNVTLWDRDDGSTSSWSRLRPGCWLSTIPACGLVLSPEAGGGCSCGSWLETSVAFGPAAGDGAGPKSGQRLHDR